jgi:endonuclease/exonuclease/phosphatase family metal-dependent hydrolase
MDVNGPLKAVTYNIHRCVGIDRRHDPGRIAAVLREIGADIIGLQEVDTSLFYEPELPLAGPVSVDRRHPASKAPAALYPETELQPLVAQPELPVRSHQLDYLTQSTGCTAVEGLLIERKTGLFGNALLTPHKVLAVRRLDLTVRGGHQRRGALDVDLEVRGKPLRVFVCHLGLTLWERHFQVRRLIKALGPDRKSPVLMMGDFNLVTSFFPKLRRMTRRLGHVPLVTTFPSFFPLLSLDRIWLQPKASLVSVTAHRSALSRVASDHLPLVGQIQF